MLPSPEADMLNKGNKNSKNKTKREKEALYVPGNKESKPKRYRGNEKKSVERKTIRYVADQKTQSEEISTPKM